MKAVILAAGPGTRLRPLTNEVPKCMVEVDGRTLLERQIEMLKEVGIKDFIFCVGIFNEKLRSLRTHCFSEYLKKRSLSSMT